MKILTFPILASTNSYIKELDTLPEENTLFRAVAQTCGRGQRGNSWESEDCRNLTFSILFYPENFHPRNQFIISCAVALGVTDFLRRYLPDPDAVKVKWPNDIYVGNRKICGILIEHTLQGAQISRSILGVGININQETFISDAPNPVSLANLTALHYPLDRLTEEIAADLETRLTQTAHPDNHAALLDEFQQNLWRFGCEHDFALPDGTVFRGKISAVAPDGLLTIIRSSDSIPLQFRFKEVAYIL